VAELMTTLASTATFSSSPLWFLTRSTGITAFVLLTMATVLGIASTQRALASPAWPRFATQQLHRNVSLLSIVLLVAHILTTLLDGYVTVGWTALAIPFLSPYHRFWVGMGTVAWDLILVVIVSSLLRTRIPARTWRVLHYFSYAAWPFALGHFIFTGTDGGGWGLWLGLVSLVLVLTAGAVRLSTANTPGPLASIRSAR
jgi:sulfoxide reductase heme-binding subunit YedZ